MLTRRAWANPARAFVVAGLCLAFGAGTAEAGRRPFLFTYDSEIVPEGDAELEQWLWSESKVPANPGRGAIYWIWWSPIFGLTNHLELALPLQIGSAANSTSLSFLSAEVRYRFLSRENDGPFQPLVRLAVKQSVSSRSGASSVEANFVATYGRPSELHVSVDLGARISLPWPEGNLARPLVASYAAGVAYPILANELRISAEFLGEQGIQDYPDSALPRHSLGGAISWTRGRVWITAGSLFGLTGLSAASPRYMPRLIWAVAF
jgi:hypothetical protein